MMPQSASALLLLPLLLLGTTATLVDVAFYQESLCPFCAEFTEKTLDHMMHTGFSKIINLRVIPWGNAQHDWSTGAVTCQHGKLECEYNELLNCALDQNPAQDDYFPFLLCIEKAARGTSDVAALGEQCARAAALDWERMWECKTSGQGHELHLKAGEATNALRPAHQFVPWVVVNGIPLQGDDELLPKFVCAAYTGPDRPAACYELDKERASGQELIVSSGSPIQASYMGALAKASNLVNNWLGKGRRAKPSAIVLPTAAA